MARIPLVDLATVVSRQRLSAGRSLPSGAVVLATRGRRLLKLNAIGTRIWELAADAMPVSDIVARICEEFDVSPDRATRDVTAFVEDLARNGILEVGN